MMLTKAVAQCLFISVMLIISNVYGSETRRSFVLPGQNLTSKSTYLEKFLAASGYEWGIVVDRQGQASLFVSRVDSAYEGGDIYDTLLFPTEPLTGLFLLKNPVIEGVQKKGTFLVGNGPQGLFLCAKRVSIPGHWGGGDWNPGYRWDLERKNCQIRLVLEGLEEEVVNTRPFPWRRSIEKVRTNSRIGVLFRSHL